MSSRSFPSSASSSFFSPYHLAAFLALPTIPLLFLSCLTQTHALSFPWRRVRPRETRAQQTQKWRAVLNPSPSPPSLLSLFLSLQERCSSGRSPHTRHNLFQNETIVHGCLHRQERRERKLRSWRRPGLFRARPRQVQTLLRSSGEFNISFAFDVSSRGLGALGTAVGSRERRRKTSASKQLHLFELTFPPSPFRPGSALSGTSKDSTWLSPKLWKPSRSPTPTSSFKGKSEFLL